MKKTQPIPTTVSLCSKKTIFGIKFSLLAFASTFSLSNTYAAPTIEKRSLSSASVKTNSNGTNTSQTPQTSTEWQLYQRILVLDEEVTQLRDQVERMQASLDKSEKLQKQRRKTLDRRLKNQENVLIEVVDKLEGKSITNASTTTLTPEKNDKAASTKKTVSQIKKTTATANNQAQKKQNSKPNNSKESNRKNVVTNEAMAKKSYLAAYDTFKKRGKTAGVTSMKTFITTYPNSKLIPSAHFWLGEFYLSGSEPNLTPAKNSFQTVLNRYPKSQKVPKSLYRLGYIAHLQNETSKARSYMNSVVKNHSQTREAGLAKVFLKRINKP